MCRLVAVASQFAVFITQFHHLNDAALGSDTVGGSRIFFAAAGVREIKQIGAVTAHYHVGVASNGLVIGAAAGGFEQALGLSGPV